MALHLLSHLGRLYAGRWRRRYRRLRWRRSRRPILHAPHPRPQRLANVHATPHHRRAFRRTRQRRRRRHCSPEHPAPLAQDRISPRSFRAPAIGRLAHHRRLRRRRPQHHRLPSRRTSRPRNCRRFSHCPCSRQGTGRQSRLLQSPSQIQNHHHRLPRMVLLSRNQRHRPHRHPPPESGGHDFSRAEYWGFSP